MTAGVRTSILAWSTFSGALLGFFAGILLVALGYAALQLLQPRSELAWLRVAAVVCLLLFPVAGAVLGFLEGRLKLL